jgi:two-component system nitrate/nitrite response regulator NarL
MPSPARHASRDRPTTVSVGDPHPLFADALGRTITAHPRLELVGAAAALDQLDGSAPDVIVLDSSLLPQLLVGEWDGRVPMPALLVVTERLDGGELYAALEAGAAGYLSKEATGAALCDAVLAVARGETVIDPDAQADLAHEVRLRTRDDRPLLTPREHEVLVLIAQGLSAPRIALRLHLGTATVKTHQLHLYAKLGATERAEAVANAMRLGLLE